MGMSGKYVLRETREGKNKLSEKLEVQNKGWLSKAIKLCYRGRILNFLTGFSVMCIVILECFTNTYLFNVFEESM